MARGQRKSIDEKIQQKEELIRSIETRLEHERQELEDLFTEKQQQEVKALNEFIKASGLSVQEVRGVLQQYLSEEYETTA